VFKMDGKTVHIKSFGCQMNKLDTALVTAALRQAGFATTDSVKEADVVLINTCSVREHAEQRVFSHLGHLKHIKKTRPNLVVGVLGCMAQRLGEKLLDEQVVDIVCGPNQIPQIPKLLTDALENGRKNISITERVRQKGPNGQDGALERFEAAYGIEHTELPNQAYVRVMRGCNKFCSYCVVPYVRGPEVSRPPQEIIEQVKKLADRGVRQVTLLGQTINSYLYKAGEKTLCLADLLEMISGVEGIEWIKFITSYPSTRFFDEILQAMATLPKVCEYLHMPAQSGSDKILRAMNRRYTAAGYLEMLEQARSRIPGIALSGDFIVGFPGETERDFACTVELVTRAKYKNCFVFKYSPRPGTTAEKKLVETVPPEVKRKRNIELLAVQEKIGDQLNKAFLNQQVIVLVEGPSKKSHYGTNDTQQHQIQLLGRTRTEHIVVFDGPASLAGRFVKVRITRTSPLTLFGILVND